MSGIFGIYNIDEKPINLKYLEEMSDILAHRGPDESDIWMQGFLGLGHRMLWTTPESLMEKLPLSSESGNLVITADARIDNRDELMAVLELPQRLLEKITDSELILAAYKKWGFSCPEHLLGDFVFVIWDKNQQLLFSARDHLGVKPFYYYYQPGQNFVFASEIKALFCLPQIPCRLNEVRIADYLTLMMEDKVITTYQEILRLPPAHVMVVKESGVQTWSYWALDPNHQVKMDSDQAYADEFRKIFTEAVRCRLRSAFPIASHLSGGLDSSAVTCVARDLLQQNKTELYTLSNIFDKITECDERPYINAVIEQGGLIPYFVPGDEIGPMSHLDKIFQYEDEALLGPSHFYPWNLNRKLKEIGLRICLDGFDGDTTVSHGITRLTELARQGKWETFAEEAKLLSPNYNVPPVGVFRNYGLPCLKDFALQFRWLTFAKAVRLIHKHFGISRKYLVLQHGIKPLIPELALRLWRKWRRRGKKSDKLVSADMALVNPDFAESISLDERIQKLEIFNTSALTLREEHWRNLTQGIIPYSLEQMDQLAAMFSLEIRHPFMDKRLIEFCLALPSEQKLYQGFGRMVMRRALDGILPEKVQWRGGKADMTPNFKDALVNRNRLHLEEVMSNKLGSMEKYIDIEFVQETYQRLLSAGNEVSSRDAMSLWQVAALASWFDYKQVKP